jgi:L-amino acid N-acyltransferase YncA
VISIGLSTTVADLEGILALGQRNHARSVAADLWATDGFVTMEYTVAQLQSMCGPYHHVLAWSGDAVVGYALVMLKEHWAAFPLLYDMFQKIEGGAIAGKPMRELRYFVMGQVCIDQAFRGQGMFGMLYDKLRQQMRGDFDAVITEVSDKNGRSMGAHRAVGFKNIALQDEVPSEWNVIAWDWT